MNWMKEQLKLLKGCSAKEQREFERHNGQVVLGRIRIISLATIFLSFFWVYMDWIIVKNGAAKIYSIILISGHIISVAASVAIVIFYNKLIDMGKNNKYPILCRVLKLYVFLYILMGTVSSINSQNYTGNIYSYIILSLVVAMAMALAPSYMLIAYVVNHIIFLIGLWVLSNDVNIFIVNTMNATVLILVAFLLSAIFFRHRMVEFLYQKKLRENEENLKKIFYVNPYPTFITRMEDGKIIEANKRACSLLEIASEGLHRPFEINYFIKNDSKLALQEELIKHNSAYNRIVDYDFNGKHMWVTANYELIDYHGEKCILTGIMDITEIRKAEEELNQYAFTDTLTGILNRRMGIKKEDLLAESKKGHLQFVLCFIDINNLKKINDTYGHNEGDRYILIVCDIIKRNLHKEDVFFRMGGDEFIIILKDLNKAQAENTWREIQQQFNKCNMNGELSYSIMASHGLFYYHSGMDIALNDIIEKADKQMYMEKQRFHAEYRANALRE